MSIQLRVVSGANIDGGATINGGLSVDSLSVNGVPVTGSTIHTTAPVAGDGSVDNPISVPVATESVAGLLSAADKTKLDNMSSGGNPGTLVTLGVDTTAWDFATGLSETDGEYEVEGHITTSTNAELVLKPNGIGTNQHCYGFNVSSAGSVAGISDQGNLFIVDPINATMTTDFLFRFISKSGRLRTFYCTTFRNAQANLYQLTGYWTDTATVVNKLTLAGPTIKSGSTVIWRKLGVTA